MRGTRARPTAALLGTAGQRRAEQLSSNFGTSVPAESGSDRGGGAEGGGGGGGTCPARVAEK